MWPRRSRGENSSLKGRQDELIFLAEAIEQTARRLDKVDDGKLRAYLGDQQKIKSRT